MNLFAVLNAVNGTKFVEENFELEVYADELILSIPGMGTLAVIPIEGWNIVDSHIHSENDFGQLLELFPWARYISKELNGYIYVSENEPSLEYDYKSESPDSYWDAKIGKFVLIDPSRYDLNISLTRSESPFFIGV